MMNTKNTLAVILNGSSSKGMHAVDQYINSYSKLLLVGHDRHELKDTVERIADRIPIEKIDYVEVDLTRKFELDKLIGLVKGRYCGADLIVDCMEITEDHKKVIFETSLTEFRNAALNSSH
jgi:short-subunit dehydrogenase